MRRGGRDWKIMSTAPFYPQLVFVDSANPLDLMPPFLTLNVVKDHSQHTIGVEFSSRTVGLGEKRIKLQVRRWPEVERLYRQLIAMSSFSYGTRPAKNGSGVYIPSSKLWIGTHVATVSRRQVCYTKLLPRRSRGYSCL